MRIENLDMLAELTTEVEWDGSALLVAAATERGRVICRVPRETVHSLHIYADAIGREIQLERHHIMEKLAPFLLDKLSRAPVDGTIELYPWEVQG